MALTDDALEKIKELIVSGELGPGDRLPPEAELSERLGLSRNSLREAVKALDFINVLDVRRGSGTYVTSLAAEDMVEAVSFLVDVHASGSLREILEVRRIFEAETAYRAASLIDETGLDELRATIADTDPTSIESLVAQDFEFHSTIARYAGNDYLAAMLEAVSVKTTRARTWRGMSEDGAVEKTLSEHRAIIDALAAGDARLAQSIMVLHVTGVQRWVDHVDVDDEDAIGAEADIAQDLQPSGD
ncbi:FadR family transcriptional regulator [Brevibacterium sediminis]|jgi:GntR family transcriptional repressor for pyruvate dehydrogenase complex|uniref:FadR/GntR family transcriptional regulator n=1 Tax=Brevibacterium sediminis TaxID=1857024 RepID=UPI0021751A48|nr:FadR/GntR family transcriptional regulator [Brevibacterium sediminis]MCS4594620.1 FadR family transcriptional regulator [Brevibacterium sediminis]